MNKGDYHDFPISFDDHIIENGNIITPKSNDPNFKGNYKEYHLSGSRNFLNKIGDNGEIIFVKKDGTFIIGGNEIETQQGKKNL
jgi:hypothetical protein